MIKQFKIPKYANTRKLKNIFKQFEISHRELLILFLQDETTEINCELLDMLKRTNYDLLDKIILELNRLNSGVTAWLSHCFCSMRINIFN